MGTKLKPWIPAVLALGVVITSVEGSACFTSMVLHEAGGNTTIETPAMRVHQAYYDDKAGRLLLLADGGTWQSDRANTPHVPVWFEMDFRAAEQAAMKANPNSRSATIAFPQNIIKRGTPDLTRLAQDGFKPIPFFEIENGRRYPLDNNVPPAGQVFVEITYLDGLVAAKNFPERLGYNPRFSMKGDASLTNVAIEIREFKDHPRPGELLLLPFSAAADAVTTPIFILGGGLK